MQRLFHSGFLLLLIAVATGCGGGGGSTGPAPTAFDQTVNVDEGDTIAIELIADKAEGVDSAISFAIDEQPKFGNLTGVAPNVIYSPPAGFVGQDQFTFKASQDGSASGAATVVVVVAPDIDLKDSRPSAAYLQKAQPLKHNDFR